MNTQRMTSKEHHYSLRGRVLSKNEQEGVVSPQVAFFEKNLEDDSQNKNGRINKVRFCKDIGDVDENHEIKGGGFSP